MGKRKKINKNNHSSCNENPVIRIKRVSLVSKRKKPKGKQKILSTALSNAAPMSQPTTSTSQENHHDSKKKWKGKRKRKSKNHNNIPFQKFFDTIGNVNDFGKSPTLTDSKSFFTPQILKPEECVIQYVRMSISPKLTANNSLAVENEVGHIVAKQPYEHVDVDADENHEDQHLDDAGDANHDDAGDANLDDAGDDNVDDAGDDNVDDAGDANVDDAGEANLDDAGEANLDAGDADHDIDAYTEFGGDVDAYTEEFDNGTNMDVEDDRNMQDTFTEQNDLHFHRLPNNKYLVEMKYQENMFIRGQLNVRVLFGSVEVLGWCINDTHDKSVALFSPRGCSNLCLEPREHSSEKRDEVESKLTALGLDSSLVAEFVNGLDESTSLVLFERSESTLYSFLGQHYPSLSLYSRALETSGRFHEMETVLKCQIQSSIFHGHCYEKSQNWEELAEEVEDDYIKNDRSRLVVCGGKGVGKSTLLRFLVNRSLQAHGEVLYLDFDPGQSEFTVPGCVSVLRVTEPVLGPNYTHIRTPERSVYLGHINIDDCPDRYIQGVQYIIDYCQSIPELNKMVWLVNTMGHPRDLGVELNMSVIGLVQPTRVAQIVSRSNARNFPVALLPENVLEGRGRWCTAPAQLDFKLFQLQSLAETRGPSALGLEPKILRNFLMLAYFHKMLGKHQNYLSDLIPYRTSLSGLALGVLHATVQPADVLGVMNAALVALCEVGPDAETLTPDDDTFPRVLTKPPLCPCLGFGVVRGIDLSSLTLYLTTPLPLPRLRAVDCITTGAVMLPPTLLLNPNAAPGLVPYLNTGPGQVTSRLVPRKFIKSRSRRN